MINKFDTPEIDLAHVAKKLSDLLSDKRERSDLVDIQTQLIMLAVHASDDKCEPGLKALLHSLMQEMRARINAMPKR